MPRITPGVTELRMQLATVGPVLPSAVLNTYGVAVNLTSPRANGGIVPLAIRAECTLALNNVQMRIRPTWSDGTTSAGIIWVGLGGADVVFQAGLLVVPPNAVPQVPPLQLSNDDFCWDNSLDLTAFWKNGVTLQQLAFDCQSAQNADTATITVTYWGLYT